MGGDAPAAKVVVTGSVTPEGRPEVMASMGGMPVPPTAGAGERVGTGAPDVPAGGVPAEVLVEMPAGELWGGDEEAWVEGGGGEEEDDEDEDDDDEDDEAATC